MPETTENYHRIPVSSGHSDHEIKTITVSGEKGIKALYCIDCKEIATYLFDVDKWTMEEAQEWVNEHKEDSMGSSGKPDRRTKDMIGSTVRYKSHGIFKAAGDGADDGEMRVRGFFTSDEKDMVGDIITKEATVKAVKGWRKWGNIRTMHDYPSGRVDKIGEEDGLDWNEIVTVPVDEDTIKLINGGVLKAYSVGIIPREYEINEEADDGESWWPPLIIHEYDMIEISYVDHPANYSATIEEVTSQKDMTDEHRCVIFKRDLTGVANMDKDVEREALEEQDTVEEEPLDEELEMKEFDGEAAEKDEEVDNEAAEEDIDTEDNEVVEDQPEPEDEFDAVLAVRALTDRMDEVEMRLDFVVDEAVIKATEAMQEMIEMAPEGDAAEEEPDHEAANEEPQEKDVESITLEQISEFLDKMRDGMVKEIVSALTPSAERTAKVVADEQDGDEQDQDTVDVSKMTRQERREYMKSIVADRYRK